MARWKLTAGHYIMTDPPAEIEFKETDRETGRQARVVRKIPTLLEPKDPGDHNYPGEIVVTDGHNAQPRDIVFLGEPTVNMEPMDDEAHKITDHLVAIGRFKKPEEGLDSSESLIKAFMDKLNKVEFQPISGAGIDPKAFADLQAQVKTLMVRNAELEAKPTRRGV